MVCFSVFGLGNKGVTQDFTWLILMPPNSSFQQHLIGSLKLGPWCGTWAIAAKQVGSECDADEHFLIMFTLQAQQNTKML